VTPVTSQVNVEGVLSAAFSAAYGFIARGEGQGAFRLSESDEAVRTTRMLSLAQYNRFCDGLRAAVQAKRTTVYGGGGDARLDAFERAVQGMSVLVDTAVRVRQTRFPHFRSIVDAEADLLARGTAVQNFVENLIVVYDDWRNALRLIALQAALGTGLRNFRAVQAEIVAEFGRPAQEAVLDLERVGYLSADGIPLVVKRSLMTASVDDEGECTDPIGTSFRGFVPPSVRIVAAISDGDEPALLKKVNVRTRGEKPPRDEGDVRKVLVFFIGGVTATEVGTLRNLGRSRESLKFIIGSTDQISADSFLEQFCPFLKTVPSKQ
jgi:hypothetical protein